jgi:hypothetical protein
MSVKPESKSPAAGQRKSASRTKSPFGLETEDQIHAHMKQVFADLELVIKHTTDKERDLVEWHARLVKNQAFDPEDHAKLLDRIAEVTAEKQKLVADLQGKIETYEKIVKKFENIIRSRSEELDLTPKHVFEQNPALTSFFTNKQVLLQQKIREICTELGLQA